MSVYSHRFHLHTGKGPWTWTCPAGYVAVVKMFAAVNASAATVQVVARIGADPVWVSNTPANTCRFDVGLQYVFNEGQDLVMLCDPQAATAYAGGYLLRDEYAARELRALLEE
jgi:hypothetical protein